MTIKAMPKHVAVSIKDRIKLIPLSDIYYFKAENKTVAINTKEEQYLVRETLSNYESDFGDEHFMRVHRNALVSTQRMKGIEKHGKDWYVAFHDIVDLIKISRHHVPTVRRWIKEGVVDSGG